jgi:hypothetical protein
MKERSGTNTKNVTYRVAGNSLCTAALCPSCENTGMSTDKPKCLLRPSMQRGRGITFVDSQATFLFKMTSNIYPGTGYQF